MPCAMLSPQLRCDLSFTSFSSWSAHLLYRAPSLLILFLAVRRCSRFWWCGAVHRNNLLSLQGVSHVRRFYLNTAAAESEESWETRLRLKWLTRLYLKLNAPAFTGRTCQTTACDQSEWCHRKATFPRDKRLQPQNRMSHNNENVTLAQGIEAKHKATCLLIRRGNTKERREGQWRGGNRGCRSTLPPAPCSQCRLKKW